MPIGMKNERTSVELFELVCLLYSWSFMSNNLNAKGHRVKSKENVTEAG